MTPRSGLTLFELLVSLALLALLAAGLAGALDTAVQVHDRTRGAAEAGEDAALRTRLRNWLAAATPPAQLATFPVTFDGTGARLEFTTLHARGFAPEAAALRISVSAESTALSLSVAELSDDGTVLRSHDRTLPGGNGARISYYDDTADPPLWRDAWEETTSLPALVRIDGAADPATWPDFTVRPALR